MGKKNTFPYKHKSYYGRSTKSGRLSKDGKFKGKVTAWADQTPEQKRGYYRGMSRWRFSQMLPSQKQALKDAQKARYAGLTQEAKRARSSYGKLDKEARKALNQSRYGKLTPEQKAARYARAKEWAVAKFLTKKGKPKKYKHKRTGKSYTAAQWAAYARERAASYRSNAQARRDAKLAQVEA
jgi:hypothetical protein